ncbi:MAG: hypothetical protein WD969_01340, partial [Paracoccaceae bacterium]
MRIIFRLVCLTALALLAPLTAVAQDYVVAASKAAGLAPGRLLQADAPLSLKAGETATLIGPSGPVEVTGPFEGVVAAAAGGAVEGRSALADLVKRRERLSAVGASRGSGAQATGAVFQLLVDTA